MNHQPQSTLAQRLREHADTHDQVFGCDSDPIQAQWRDDLLAAAQLADADAMHRPSYGPTVRVRIAVCVRDAGNWAASGYCVGGMRDAHEDIKVAAENSDGGLLRWVEADVPLPEDPTIAGTVVDGEGGSDHD